MIYFEMCTSRIFYPYLKVNFDFLTNQKQANEIYDSKEFKNTLVSFRITGKTKVEKYKDCIKEIDGYLGIKNEK